MKIHKTKIPEVFLIVPDVFQDERGWFMETFQVSEYSKLGIPYIFVQDNHSRSRRGVLRGLHYQIIHPQGKLIRVILGEVYDVVVDIRKGSSTFGKWVGEYLTANNKVQLWAPPGFAHGYYVLSEWAEFIYKTTDYYAPGFERTLLWNDPDILINWPLINGELPLLSLKDSQGKLLAEAEVFDIDFIKPL
jgi:dTDP-4-dehydrorhamnose 3,5-epimerase